jgi:hypothetical protein
MELADLLFILPPKAARLQGMEFSSVYSLRIIEGNTACKKKYYG